jgi:hypothetical protein
MSQAIFEQLGSFVHQAAQLLQLVALSGSEQLELSS